MTIKRYLPFQYPREGYLPDRLHLQFFDGGEAQCREYLTHKRKTAHFFLSEDGTAIALTPLTAAANLLGALYDDCEISAARRGILILIQGKEAALKPLQFQSLVRLLQTVQREFLRIYGEPFDFRRETLLCDENLPWEALLEEGIFHGNERTVFRVQTGNYKSYRDAEDSVERLQRAGIAAYVTEVRY